jgi:hypothetical protein
LVRNDVGERETWWVEAQPGGSTHLRNLCCLRVGAAKKKQLANVISGLARPSSPKRLPEPVAPNFPNTPENWECAHPLLSFTARCDARHPDATAHAALLTNVKTSRSLQPSCSNRSPTFLIPHSPPGSRSVSSQVKSQFGLAQPSDFGLRLISPHFRRGLLPPWMCQRSPRWLC